jgi:hypothetical protein
MGDEWLTYREGAERIGSTPEAVRYRAMRGKWQRRRGNDGRARIQLPDDPNPVRTPSAQPVRTPSEPRADLALLHALEAHNATLKADVERLEAQLAAAEARDAQHVAQLAAEQAKTEKAIEAFSALAQRLEAMAAQHAIKPWWQRLLRSAG